jgi:PAS domain S-box-containing protein
MKMALTLTAQKFLNNVHGLIIVLNRHGIIMFVNNYGAELLGYPKNEILGHNWFNHFIPSENRKQYKARFKQFLNGKLSELQSKDQYVKTKDGDLHLIEWHDTCLQDKNQNIIGTFSSGEDVTEIPVKSF